MAGTFLSDHVLLFEDALSAEHCEMLIKRFEESSEQEPVQREDGHSFVQLDVTKNWPDQNEILLPIFMSHFNQYGMAVKTRFWPPRFTYENLRLKRYLPNGRDSFPLHVDVMTHEAARRFMTAMIYLNDATDGETVFPTLGVSVAPQRGRLLAFPPIWMFPHAGQPPRVNAKYILHTYLCYPPSPQN